MTEQQLINALLTLYVNTANSQKLEALLINNFFPDNSIDLLIEAAENLTDAQGRRKILDILNSRVPTPSQQMIDIVKNNKKQ